jgi:hypothetical protein
VTSLSFPETNLKFQKTYKKKLLVGDIFQLAYPNSKFLYGQVVSLTASAGGFSDCIKVYIFDFVSEEAITPSTTDSYYLLCEPLFINRLGFSRGFMPVIKNSPPLDVKDNSDWCFYSVPFKKYFDENGNSLDMPTKKVGTWGLSNYLVLDEKISTALGYELPNVSG